MCRLRLVCLSAALRCRRSHSMPVCLSPRPLNCLFVCASAARFLICKAAALAHRLLVCSLACARAVKLKYGAANTNFCPAGSYVITDLEQCRAAAATAGSYWSGSTGGSFSPRGCFRHQFSDYVALNMDSPGGPDPDCRPLCAVGAAGVRAVRACDGIIHISHAETRTYRHLHADTHAHLLRRTHAR